MRLLARPFLRVTVVSLICALTALSRFSLLALADEPPSFEISVVPQVEYAVAGQAFTYTVVITNVSEASPKDVVVRVKTPEGTTFADTHFTNPNWYVNEVRRGETGEIAWLSREPVASGGVVTFELAVNVLPEMASQQLTNEGYTVAIGNHAPIAFGPPIRTEVLIAAPTAITTPSSSATVTSPGSQAAIPSSTPASLADSASDKATPGGMSVPVPSKTTSQAATKAETSSPSPGVLFIVFIGLSVFAIVAVGLISFLRRR
jgi:uncharacterized repeat protein (TIGR01451 family)